MGSEYKNVYTRSSFRCIVLLKNEILPTVKKYLWHMIPNFKASVKYCNNENLFQILFFVLLNSILQISFLFVVTPSTVLNVT